MEDEELDALAGRFNELPTRQKEAVADLYVNIRGRQETTYKPTVEAYVRAMKPALQHFGYWPPDKTSADIAVEEYEEIIRMQEIVSG